MINRKKIFNVILVFLISLVTKAQPHFGDNAMEIALPSVTGDTIKLSSLKGKIVLLDFWASWCGPCRFTNKQLAKLYPKYKEKGFEIFSVSLDTKKKDWTKAIAKDKISWLQVNDDGGWDALTVANWKLYAIPTSYLIDKDGKLVATDLLPKDLEKQLKDMLGN
jgi:peroxiredoxin